MKENTHLLIVDDEPTLRMGFEYALSTEGYQITVATDGVDALSIINNAAPHHFSVMVLDLRMPGKDGIEVLRDLRSEKIFLPTILASAFVDSATAVQAIDLGVVDFLRKPITPTDLRGVVELVVQEEKTFTSQESGIESKFPVDFARWCIRRGDLKQANEMLKNIESNNERSGLWKFVASHLLACKSEEDGVTEFASSRFYKASDLLTHLAYNK